MLSKYMVVIGAEVKGHLDKSQTNIERNVSP